MRIQIISLMEAFPWGGSEELWNKIALELIQSGHKVQVCVRGWADEPKQITHLKSKGAQIVKRSRNKYKTALGWLLSKLMKRKLELNVSYRSSLQRFKPNAILVSNGGVIDCFEHDLIFGLLDQAVCPLFIISQFNHENGPPIPTVTANRIKELAIKWNRFYFVADRNRITLQRQLALEIPRAEVISNPVNIVSPGITPWPVSSTLHMACVARYECSYKGQDILLQALSEPEFKGYNYKLNFFGAGPDKEHLEKLVRFYDLSDNVKINDYAENVDAIWETHHILVLTSLAEGTPLSLQECMTKGRPALVSDVGGNSSLIEDGVNGLLASTSSVSCLKEKLIQLFQTDRSQLEAWGRNAFKTASERIDTESYKKIITDLMSSINDNSKR